MDDFLDTPTPDFAWGPDRPALEWLREHLPALAIGSGLVLSIAGLISFVQG